VRTQAFEAVTWALAIVAGSRPTMVRRATRRRSRVDVRLIVMVLHGARA
jgi:hypothetical protein